MGRKEQNSLVGLHKANGSLKARGADGEKRQWQGWKRATVNPLYLTSKGRTREPSDLQSKPLIHQYFTEPSKDVSVHFFKTHEQMANKYMKRCPMTLTIRGM